MATENSHSVWHTPDELIQVLKREFAFDLDAAATIDNSICERFISPEQNALVTPWDGRCVFVNPPYGEGLKSSISLFVKRAYEQHLEFRNTMVMLLPTYSDPKYWSQYVMQAHEIRNLVGRLAFLDHGVRKTSARFPSSVVVWKFISGHHFGKAPNQWSWDWRAV